MWWKLGGLIVVTAAIVISLLPIRTRAAIYDPEKPPPRATLGDLFANMFVAPRTVAMTLAILAVAGFVGFKIVRGEW